MQASRGRGRPPGGGNTAEQARELLLDAAERSFVKGGYQASTMRAIAQEAGYSRAVIYRHFATRDEFLEALAVRVAERRVAQIVDRVDGAGDISELIVESLVIVATEIANDPLLAIISEGTPDGNVADLIAKAPSLVSMVTSLYESAFVAGGPGYAREGLRPTDAAHFVLSVALGLLLGIVPGTDDPAEVRRYITVFVLPALLADPPAARAVFKPL